MRYILSLAVLSILLLQWTRSIPMASVGGSLAIAVVFVAAALAVGIHEAWMHKRRVAGWIVNIVVSFFGAVLAAQIGGFLVVMLLGSVATVESSVAKSGEPLMSLALAGGMVATVLGAWAALRIVERWR
ncbi:hypothetical protein [Prosthecodimorpha staleyi]|uniref:Uncharacterized protein n=1 Tax=Prosthecodimorpha staleyi TaxID=2840188 RepID=A0A947D624_9HYPH|nr:hypothetical protein [Prosthecodimorpha staleyi]MBT9288867.1 hypothetical protein [Prosthecodimorpha staleyi]